MSGAAITVPKDIVRFEVLLYLSLLLDTLTAAFFSEAPEASRASVSLVNAALISAFVGLVWLAARRHKNWARWTLFGFFVLTVVLYIQAFGDLEFSIGTAIDMLSLALSGLGFYFGFTSEAQLWFSASAPSTWMD